MNGPQIVYSFLIALFGSTVAGLIIVKTAKLHGRFTLDKTSGAIHKFHNVPVPRVGGIAVFFGLTIGSLYFGLDSDQRIGLGYWAGIAVLPLFLGGLAEDLFKSITPRDRLLLAFISATVAFFQLDVQIVRLSIPAVDYLLNNYPQFSLLVTVIMVAGVSHATNIIDGFHGLLLGTAIITLSVFLLVAIAYDHPLLIAYLAITLGACVGLFLLNFPLGKIFLGDSGAYLIGFLLAIFSILLVNYLAEISPWFPLTVLSYPITETLFSIYRKSILKSRSPMKPDRAHLHMLVYRALRNYSIFYPANIRNPATTIVILILTAWPALFALNYPSSTLPLALTFIIFVLFYLILYKFLLLPRSHQRITLP